MDFNIDLLKEKIVDIVNDIANNNYSKIEMEQKNGRVNINDLKRSINEYGRTIIPLPNEAFKFMEIYHVESKNMLHIVIDLWTKEEGRSDLTLSLNAYIKNNLLFIEIDDCHVL